MSRKIFVGVITAITVIATLALAIPAFAQGTLPWHFDATFGGFVIDEPVNGSTDVGISEDLAEMDPTYGPLLMNVRNGVAAKWTTTVDGEIVMCVGEVYLNGTLIETKVNCDGKNVEVGPGEIVIKNSVGPTGGFRWTPSAGTGWHTEDTRTTCPPMDGTCWEQQGADWVWTGSTDGSADIHQASMSDVLEWVRSGGVVEINTTVEGQIVGTCHIKVELLDSNGTVTASYVRHDCGLIDTAIKVPAGHLRLSNSTSEAGGWRWSPMFGFGWRASQTAPANYQFVELTPVTAGPAVEPTTEATEEATEEPAAAGTPEAVTATLREQTSDNRLIFDVSSNGEYLLLQEGNEESEQLRETAVNGSVAFTTKPGNTAFQLVGVQVTSSDPNWIECEGAEGWFCFSEAEAAAPAGAAAPAASELTNDAASKGKFPWWIFLVLAGVVGAGFVWWLMNRNRGEETEAAPEPPEPTRTFEETMEDIFGREAREPEPAPEPITPIEPDEDFIVHREPIDVTPEPEEAEEEPVIRFRPIRLRAAPEPEPEPEPEEPEAPAEPAEDEA